MNTVRHNRHNSIGSGKTVETLDDDETGIDEGIEKERKEAGLYGGGFHLVDWTLGKLSSLKPLFENWEDCFVSAMGTHTHTNACTRIIKPTQTRDLGWRGGEGEGDVQIILYEGEAEPVGDARLWIRDQKYFVTRWSCIIHCLNVSSTGITLIFRHNVAVCTLACVPANH